MLLAYSRRGLIKVKAHCGEPLNEAADALASAAAEADGAPMSGELQIDPCAVHFYLNHNVPVEWDSWVRMFLTRESGRLQPSCWSLARGVMALTWSQQ